MAHEHAREMVEAQTGKAGTQILVTLLGGVLLLAGGLAYWIFDQTYYAEAMAMIASIMLGGPLVWTALKGLATGHTHMDELAALAVTAAFAMGEYFEAGSIAFFMVISVLIEHRTALGARRSIESLVRLTPTRAFRVNTDEQGLETEQEVEAHQLRPGDVVVIRPGDNIPGDGVILSGATTVNQANITGESLPADKSQGDEVFGGTINLTGLLKVKIAKAGGETTLGRVKELILQAEASRTPIMRLIDRYAGWYAPTMLMIIFIVWFFSQSHDATGAANAAIAMMVIACPCAFILATPTAMVAALSAAARLGILIKNVTDLETARKLSAVVFDKTGTLTTGQLSVTRLKPAPGVDGAELLLAAATAEQHSRHPVARAIAEVARRARIQPPGVTEYEEVAGRGVKARTESGSSLLVGRAVWLAEQGVDLSNIQDDPTAEGLSLLMVARDGRALGWVGLEDKTRPEAAHAMEQLRRMGIKKLVMLTGDRWSVARRVADEMKCTDVEAEVLPAQKLRIVDDLKRRGHTVAVVGDGVNDAPALAAGNISIAMGAAGSDVAIHSASIALMNNNLDRIPFLISLSVQTFKVIRQNLAISVAYILVFQTLAAMGKVSPIMAVLLHLVSSFVVIFNSARLVRAGEELDPSGTVAPGGAGRFGGEPAANASLPGPGAGPAASLEAGA